MEKFQVVCIKNCKNWKTTDKANWQLFQCQCEKELSSRNTTKWVKRQIHGARDIGNQRKNIQLHFKDSGESEITGRWMSNKEDNNICFQYLAIGSCYFAAEVHSNQSSEGKDKPGKQKTCSKTTRSKSKWNCRTKFLATCTLGKKEELTHTSEPFQLGPTFHWRHTESGKVIDRKEQKLPGVPPEAPTSATRKIQFNNWICTSLYHHHLTTESRLHNDSSTCVPQFLCSAQLNGTHVCFAFFCVTNSFVCSAKLYMWFEL